MVSTAFELCLLPGLDGIENQQILGYVKGLVRQGDEICPDLSGLIVVDAEDGLISGIGDLLGIFRKLDLGDKFPVFIQNGRQLVHAPEGGAIAGGNHIGSHAPGGNGCILALQTGDQVLVQIAGGGDHCVRETGLIQHLPGFLGHIGQVAAVQTDSVEGQGNPGFAHFCKDTDGVGHAGFQSVVGICQQNAGVRIEFGILLKGCIFVRETHNPAVGMGSLHRYVKELAGQDVGGADTAADHGSPCAVDAGVRSLGAAESEFHNAVAFCRVNHPGSLGGDEALVVDNRKNSRFDKLGLHNGGHHFYQGFSGEDYRSFRDGIDIAGEAEIAQVVQKIFFKKPETF